MGVRIGGERTLGLEKARVEAKSSEGRRLLSILALKMADPGYENSVNNRTESTTGTGGGGRTDSAEAAGGCRRGVGAGWVGGLGGGGGRRGG